MLFAQPSVYESHIPPSHRRLYANLVKAIERKDRLPKGSTTGWWRIADYWTLPENDQRPLADFERRVKQRIAAERLPRALLPDDL